MMRPNLFLICAFKKGHIFCIQKLKQDLIYFIFPNFFFSKVLFMFGF